MCCKFGAQGLHTSLVLVSGKESKRSLKHRSCYVPDEAGASEVNANPLQTRWRIILSSSVEETQSLEGNCVVKGEDVLTILHREIDAFLTYDPGLVDGSPFFAKSKKTSELER